MQQQQQQPIEPTFVLEELVTTKWEPVDQPALSSTPPALKGKKKKVDKGKAKRRSSPPHNLFSLLDMLMPPTAHIDKVYKVPRDFYPISTKGWENLGDDNDAGDVTPVDPSQDDEVTQLHWAPAL